MPLLSDLQTPLTNRREQHLEVPVKGNGFHVEELVIFNLNTKTFCNPAKETNILKSKFLTLAEQTAFIA